MTEYRVYKYRWIILLIYCLYSSINLIQVVQFTIISNITEKFYNVSSTYIELTSLCFSISFIFLFLPIQKFTEKYNLKTTAIVSSGLTAAGTVVKVFSTSRDRFYVVLIGQILCALGDVFIINVPAKLASIWFGPNQVSLACAIAVFGLQIGGSLGCILSPIFVKNAENLNYIQEDLKKIMIYNAGFATASFVLVIFFFRAAPKTPASQSQLDKTKTDFSLTQSLKKLFKNKNYVIVLLSFGSCSGLWNAFGVLINPIYLHYFPNHESEVGIISFIASIVGGCVGSLIFGYLLDKYHRFKLMSIFVFVASLITYISVALTLELTLNLASYFTISLFGFFIGSSQLVAFEFTTEITYPVPEVSSCSILNAFSFLFTTIYCLLFDSLINAIGFKLTHCVVAILLFLSAFLVYFVKEDLKRRRANQAKTEVCERML